MSAGVRGKWVGIHAYIDHLEEETGERYKVSNLYGGLVFCDKCWKSNDKRTDFCPNCGTDMRGKEKCQDTLISSPTKRRERLN